MAESPSGCPWGRNVKTVTLQSSRNVILTWHWWCVTQHSAVKWIQKGKREKERVRGAIKQWRRTAGRVKHPWRLTLVLRQCQLHQAAYGIFLNVKRGCDWFKMELPPRPRACLNVNIWLSDILLLQPLDFRPPQRDRRKVEERRKSSPGSDARGEPQIRGWRKKHRDLEGEGIINDKCALKDLVQK